MPGKLSQWPTFKLWGTAYLYRKDITLRFYFTVFWLSKIQGSLNRTYQNNAADIMRSWRTTRIPMLRLSTSIFSTWVSLCLKAFVGWIFLDLTMRPRCQELWRPAEQSPEDIDAGEVLLWFVRSIAVWVTPECIRPERSYVWHLEHHSFQSWQSMQSGSLMWWLWFPRCWAVVFVRQLQAWPCQHGHQRSCLQEVPWHCGKMQHLSHHNSTNASKVLPLTEFNGNYWDVHGS